MRVNGLTETFTIWTAIDNGLGGYTYSGPQLVKGRWEEKAEQFRDKMGEEKVSKAIVYLDRDAATGDWIYRGDASGNADPPAGSHEIQAYHKSPDLRNVTNFRKAYL